MFAGGYGVFGYSAVVDVWDSDTLDWKVDHGLVLSIAREELVATSVGMYALFAGGIEPPNDWPSNVVDLLQIITTDQVHR